MKVLFIGGTGIISSACARLGSERGIDVYILNRGQSFTRPAPPGAHVLHGDIRQPDAIRQALKGQSFDVVVDWVAYTPKQVETDLQLFKDCTQQYIFISSASVYQTPPSSLPVTESTLLDNPYWKYSQDKIACEEMLVRAYRQEKFPMTIVRPSHTYDKASIPLDGGYTTLDRMRKGKPVIVLGDGTSLWTLTHHEDFATGFVGLLGNSRAVGEVFHITSDEWLTWNQIYEIMARAAGVVPKLVHIPSELLAAYDQEWGAGLLGDKSHTMIFDNSKIKRLAPDFKCRIPFSQGAEEIIAWHDTHPELQVVEEGLNLLADKILSAYQKAWPALI